MGTTKIGVPAKLLAAFAYLAAFFSGYVAFLLIGGYILIREQNDWLRFHAVKAGVIMVCFSIANALISLIPSLFTWIDDLLGIFGGSFRLAFIYNGQSWLATTLAVLEKVLFLVLAFMAFKGSDLKLGPVDKLVNTLLGLVPAAPVAQAPAAPVAPVAPVAPASNPVPTPVSNPIPTPVSNPIPTPVSNSIPNPVSVPTQSYAPYPAQPVNPQPQDPNAQ